MCSSPPPSRRRDEAVRMFRLAAAHGSTEAATSLGWMYNTGQY